MSDEKQLEPLTARRGGMGGALPLLALAPLAFAATWLLYSATRINHNHELTPALDAERRTFAFREAGVLSYYVDRRAGGSNGDKRKTRPIVLIHSINAAGSSYEMRPLFEYYRTRRPVYALDLPGFGFSDRAERAYSPTLYREAIRAFLESQVREGGPVDIVALSLSSEFAASVALSRPELVRSLTMISPTGFTARSNLNGSQAASQNGLGEMLYRTFNFPLWGQAFYDLLASRPSLRYFLQMSFAGDVNRDMLDYAYATAHRPGARNAPFYFVSGKLFTPNIRSQVYERLTQPTLVLYDADPYVRFDELPDMVARHAQWRTAHITPTRGLPHWECLDETTNALDKFWGALA